LPKSITREYVPSFVAHMFIEHAAPYYFSWLFLSLYDSALICLITMPSLFFFYRLLDGQSVSPLAFTRDTSLSSLFRHYHCIHRRERKVSYAHAHHYRTGNGATHLRLSRPYAFSQKPMPPAPLCASQNSIRRQAAKQVRSAYHVNAVRVHRLQALPSRQRAAARQPGRVRKGQPAHTVSRC